MILNSFFYKPMIMALNHLHVFKYSITNINPDDVKKIYLCATTFINSMQIKMLPVERRVREMFCAQITSTRELSWCAFSFTTTKYIKLYEQHFTAIHIIVKVFSPFSLFFFVCKHFLKSFFFFRRKSATRKTLHTVQSASLLFNIKAYSRLCPAFYSRKICRSVAFSSIFQLKCIHF